MDPAARLPESLVERALAFEDGSRTPAEPRFASTVVLLRDGDGQPGGLEVYLLRRHADMAFAAGMCVFPGGGVDPRDYDRVLAAGHWAGPSPAAWAARMGVEEPLAQALVCAAVRETFEESGVLLAGPATDPAAVVADTRDDAWEADRRALEAREISFTELLDRRDLVLRSDLLRLWGSWVTPTFEPRRYDTQFFLAALPSGQATRDVSTESDRVSWLSLRDALREVDDQRLLMMPPTYLTCAELYEHVTLEAALAAAEGRDLTPVRPAAVATDGGAYLSMPQHLVALVHAVRRRRGP